MAILAVIKRKPPREIGLWVILSVIFGPLWAVLALFMPSSASCPECGSLIAANTKDCGRCGRQYPGVQEPHRSHLIDVENMFYGEGRSAEDIASHFNSVGEAQSAAKPGWDAKDVYKILVEQKSFDNRYPFTFLSSESQQDTFEEVAPSSEPRIGIQEDPLLTKCVRLTSAILDSQKQLIIARHPAGMPEDAADAFSIGYIAGASLYISTMHRAGPDGYFLSLEIASKKLLGELGANVKHRASAYVDTMDPDFLKGKETAEHELESFFRQEEEKRNLVVPPMGWAFHVIKAQA